MFNGQFPGHPGKSVPECQTILVLLQQQTTEMEVVSGDNYSSSQTTTITRITDTRVFL